MIFCDICQGGSMAVRSCIHANLRLFWETALSWVHNEILLVAYSSFVGHNQVLSNWNFFRNKMFTKHATRWELAIEWSVSARWLLTKKRSDNQFLFIFCARVAQGDSATLEFEIERRLVYGAIVVVDGVVICWPWCGFYHDGIAFDSQA